MKNERKDSDNRKTFVENSEIVLRQSQVIASVLRAPVPRQGGVVLVHHRVEHCLRLLLRKGLLTAVSPGPSPPAAGRRS